MPLYIRDDDVAALARQVQAASGSKTVTDTVRVALLHELGRLREGQPLGQRLAKALAIADAIGRSHVDR